MIAECTAMCKREQRLQQVLVEYLEALEAGRAVDRQTLQARYPEFAAEVAELLANREKLDRLTAPLRAMAQAESIDMPCRPEENPGATLPEGGRSFGDYEILEEIGRGGTSLRGKGTRGGAKEQCKSASTFDVSD
jgi:hypothetical protein